MPDWMRGFAVPSFCLLFGIGIGRGQTTVPTAPEIIGCRFSNVGTGQVSACQFKHDPCNTPTSVMGSRVILFDRSRTGEEAEGRQAIREALGRLSVRYGFELLASEDPAVFTPENLAKAKVVVMSNGDGDVLAAGRNRTALEDFQQRSGWGVIWIHHACKAITSGWPFGQQNCVQQISGQNPAGTRRRLFIDSGTAANPDQGLKNPQTEFLLRDLPGWGGKRNLEMADEWPCFPAPARATAGVNVLFGYDRGSGLPPSGCPNPTDTSEAASQAHNLAWTHMMGKGINIVATWGHDSGAYVSNGHMGDSLLWRYLRYAAKDWMDYSAIDWSDWNPDCGPTAIRAVNARSPSRLSLWKGTVSVTLPGAGRYEVWLTDLDGRNLGRRSAMGPGVLDIPAGGRGLFMVHVRGEGISRSHRVMLY
jgi:hypothetical protein